MKLNIREIKLMLARKAMTNGQLADKSGISRQMMSIIISRGTCSTVNAGRIASGLGIDVSEIVEEV